MNLIDWMRFMTDKVREPFDSVTLDAADACAEDHKGRGALVLCFIGVCAHQGWTTDETAKFVQYWFLFHELGSHGEDPAPDGDLIDRLISPVIKEFLMRGAPWSRPWDATGLYSVLVWHYLTILADQAPWNEIEEKEVPRWTAGGALAVPLPSARPYRATVAGLSERLRRLGLNEQAAEAKRREDDRAWLIDQWPAEMQIREDLQEMFALRHWITWMQAQTETLPLPQDAREELARLLDATAARELDLPPLERELLEGGPDANTQFCRDCLAAMSERMVLVGSFPDRVKSQDVLARMPENFVGGSRPAYTVSTTARTCLVYVLNTSWQIAGFERFFETGGVDVRIFSTRIALRPLIPDDPLPPLEFDRRSVHSLWSLLLYLGGGFATVRVLRLDDRAFRLLDHRGQRLTADVSKILARPLATSLRHLTGGDPSNFPAVFRKELEVGEKSLERVMATEMARGRFLVSEFDLRFRPPAACVEDVMSRYSQARDRLLDMRATEAVANLATSNAAPSSEHVRAAQQEMTDLQWRLHIAREDPLRSLRRILANHDRALVLLRMDGGTVYADWACTYPTGDDVSDQCSSELFTESLELGGGAQLVDVANEWFESKTPDSLENVLDLIAREIMIPLWIRLGDKKDLLLSPTWFLGLLPLHAAPIQTERRAIDLFRSITYVPSGVLLDRVIELGPVCIRDSLAGTSTQPVSGAAEELAILETLFAGTTVTGVTPETVLRKPAPSIVHLAAHGYAKIGGWSSGIQLSGDSPAAGYLSLARLLQEGDFSATGVANIAACESGLELNYELLPDEYLSIDNALLACGARTVISSLWELSGSVSVLFSACFYASLAAGAQVQDAHRAAISAVRSLDEVDLPPQVSSLLGRVSPGWREKLQREEERIGVRIHDPYFWACFKCTGWSWGALHGLRAAEHATLPPP